MGNDDRDVQAALDKVHEVESLLEVAGTDASDADQHLQRARARWRVMAGSTLGFTHRVLAEALSGLIADTVRLTIALVALRTLSNWLQVVLFLVAFLAVTGLDATINHHKRES